ncbi:MAG: hypothetical protein ACFHU9_18115 [Fluviicola sp.]
MKYLIFLLVSVSTSAFAQNVGIGTNAPQEKLHVNGAIRSDSLANTDTNVVVSDVDGTLINLETGTSGQVLTSQGPGLSPQWTTMTSGATGGKIHFGSLSSTFSITVNSSTAPSGSLLSYSFVPDNDTVIVNFSSQGDITSSSIPATPAQHYLFRIYVNGALYKQTYSETTRNLSSGFVPTNFTHPIAVNAGVSNTVEVRIFTLFTTSGSISLTYDPTALSQYAHFTIYDFPTN